MSTYLRSPPAAKIPMQNIAVALPLRLLYFGDSMGIPREFVLDGKSMKFALDWIAHVHYWEKLQHEAFEIMAR